MTPEEYVKYCLERDLPCLYKDSNFTIAFDPVYNEKILNDLSKPVVVLLYNHVDNTIIFSKFNIKTCSLIYDDTTETLKCGNVKDQQTFLTYVKSINSYCRKHNCDYNTYINNNFVVYYKEDSISIKSPINPNQEIIYDRANKRIIFFKSRGSNVLQLGKTLSNFIDEKDNFTEFAKESFEFCKENESSFEDYAKEIAYDILGFKYGLNKYAKEHQQEKWLYTFFDKDNKTGFAYYSDNTINAFKTIYNHSIYHFTYFKMHNKPSFPLKSNEEFKTYIKTNKASIDKEVDKRVKNYREQQELKGFAGAIGDVTSLIIKKKK